MKVVRIFTPFAVCCAAVAAVALAVPMAYRPYGAGDPVKANLLVLPSDADVRRMLAARIDAIGGKQGGIGIVVGILGPRGRRIVSYGRRGEGDPSPMDGDTVFEIGSVSKVFTALLLGEMVGAGEVQLSDPVAKYLPAGVKVPEHNGRKITLLDLAIHTSGLPFMSDDVPVYNVATAGTGENAQLYRFLGRYQLTRDPGAKWDYSNIGYWLLGEALSSRAGVDYETLLRKRVLAPLAMKDTAITLTPRLKAKLAVGHNAVLLPAAPFSSVSIYSAMPAAGGLVSTVSDLLKLLSVCMGYEPSSLTSSTTAMLNTRHPIDGSDQALGWVVVGKGSDQLIEHEGSTWGYSGYVGWSQSRRVGIVVLSNQLASVADIGRHLLRPDFALEKQVVTKHTEVPLDPAMLDAYAGRYEVKDEGIFRVMRENGFLTFQMPPGWGLPVFRLRPEGPRDFFVAELPIRVTFQTDDDRRVKGLLVYPPRGQRGLPANRIGSDQ
jgi:D-alanyl-D-alanine-carboxypeptidase/D-alanyl-D-alanine-endopeptidase